MLSNDNVFDATNKIYDARRGREATLRAIRVLPYLRRGHREPGPEAGAFAKSDEFGAQAALGSKGFAASIRASNCTTLPSRAVLDAPQPKRSSPLGQPLVEIEIKLARRAPACDAGRNGGPELPVEAEGPRGDFLNRH